MNTSPGDEKIYKGITGNLVLTKDFVILKRGFRSYFEGGLTGEKKIPYSNITAVQFKKPGVMVGYLQLTIKGAVESTSMMFINRDENTITFRSKKSCKEFEEAKTLIEERVKQTNQTTTGTSNLGDLEKLAELVEKGIITKSEFEAKKKQILGL